MNTSQLQCAIQCDKQMQEKIKGVYASNQIVNLNIKSTDTGIIVNTDSSDKPGRHWLAFYFTSYEQIECFDSYGLSPEYYSHNLGAFVKKYESVVTNNKQLQGPNTMVCGQYCLFYLMHRCRGYSMNDIVNMFSSDTYVNDQFVYDFIQNSWCYYRYNACNSSSQKCTSRLCYQ